MILCKIIRRTCIVVLALILFMFLTIISHAESYDITVVTDITPEELEEHAPEWCKPYCDLIVDLSNEYEISSEFAISVFRYEYVEERNSVGAWKSDGLYSEYDTIEESIKEWFKNMSETYCNENSWHYNQTKGTEIDDIAPVYCQGTTEYDEQSYEWKEKIEDETLKIIEKNNHQN